MIVFVTLVSHYTSLICNATADCADSSGMTMGLLLCSELQPHCHAVSIYTSAKGLACSTTFKHRMDK
jgi:hypothetical protein